MYVLSFVSYIQLSFHSVYSELIKEVLALDDQIKSIADELYEQKSLLVMGRGYHYATCLEGALVSTIYLEIYFIFNMNEIKMSNVNM